MKKLQTYLVKDAAGKTVYSVKAFSLDNAKERIVSLHGRFDPSWEIISWVDNKAEEDLVFEQTHKGYTKREWKQLTDPKNDAWIFGE